MKTYSAMRGGLRGFVGDARRLYRVRTRNLAGDVAMTMRQLRTVEASYRSATGDELRGRRVLVVGSGQTAREVTAFATSNDVTAIDLDVLPRGWRPGPYLQLLRENGPTRAAKTVGRKLLGVDRRFDAALCRELAIDRPRPARFLQMDATRIALDDSTFDLVYSFSVFEHLPDPEAVLREAQRVLRPGGLLYVSLHLYSSEGGCHDLRIFAGDRAGIPFWAHLRPPVKHTVIESCYMNEWRLDRWRELFTRCCPGAELSIEPHHEPYASELAAALDGLRRDGELIDHSDEELLAVNLRCSWRKPG